MIPRTLFSDEHEIFRASARRFVEQEVAPYHAQWEKDGQVSREVWRKAGGAGLLLASLPEAMGGPGGDFLMSAILIEELARKGLTGPGFHLHSEIVAPYIVQYGTPEQQAKYLPRMVSGEASGAIAVCLTGILPARLAPTKPGMFIEFLFDNLGKNHLS